MHLKTIVFAGLWIAALLLVGCKEQPAPDFESRLEGILNGIDAILADVDKGETPDLVEELAALDQLVVAEAGTSAENAARALRRKASIQVHYLEDHPAGKATLEELVSRFPGTEGAQSAEKMLVSLQIQAGLVPGAWFPDFQVKDLQGKALSLSQFKGTIVLVDFWATWCPPCLEELPHVKAAYEQFHDRGFEIIGISLDRKQATLERFLEREAMTWPQVCDLEGWDSRLVGKYGIMSIPSTYLLDRDGRIIATDLRGDDLESHLTRLLGVP